MILGSYKKLTVLGVLLLSVVPVLSACSLYEDGHITPNRVQVEKEKFFQEIPVGDLDKNKVAGLAKYYDKHGDGPMALTIVYDPSSRSSTAMAASSEASRIIKDFRKNGVRDIKPGILPVNGRGDELTAIVSFVSYIALAPKDCEVMPGVDDTDIRVEESYKLGCTIDTVLAKQIARPKDLVGRSDSGMSSGRRGANVVDVYRTGEPNGDLGGESASGE